MGPTFARRARHQNQHTRRGTERAQESTFPVTRVATLTLWVKGAKGRPLQSRARWSPSAADEGPPPDARRRGVSAVSLRGQPVSASPPPGGHALFPADPAILHAISQPTRWCSPQQRCPGRHGVDFHGVLQRPVSHPGVRNPHSSQAGTHGDRARESLPSFLRQSLYSQRGCFELELCSAWHPVRCPVRNR